MKGNKKNSSAYSIPAKYEYVDILSNARREACRQNVGISARHN
jgi:hypothetical protein